MKKLILLSFLILSSGFIITSCKNKDESIAKIFVRNSNSQLIRDAQVVIIADVNSDPATPEYVDTMQTNESGFASFDLERLFDQYGKKDDKVAFFDIIVKFDDKQANGEIKARANITAVETIALPQ
ncbi:MAG: hypothetical protein ACPGU5_08720 [Lishizhenia sp.]